MKKLLLLGAISLMAVACQRADSSSPSEINKDAVASCNKVLVTDFSKTNLFGTLVRTTCSPGPGIEAEDLPTSAAASSPLFEYRGSQTAKVKTKSVHFWFYGSASDYLFKPVAYARIFVFPIGDSRVDQAKAQIASGNHYLGFDRGIFKDVYTYAVVNINHKQDASGKITSSYNLENEIKKSVPVDSRIFVQFIVQYSPDGANLNNLGAKYSYADFTNADNGVYQHFKIDLDDTALGYEGNSFYY